MSPKWGTGAPAIWKSPWKKKPSWIRWWKWSSRRIG